MDYLALPTRTDKDGHSAIDYNQLQLNEIAMLTGKAPWTPIATPAANPPTGKYFMYFKSDGKLYKLNEDGDEAEIVAAPAGINCKVLLVAGGGGGGSEVGGGGGGGGVKYFASMVLGTGLTLPVVIGAGGAGAVGGGGSVASPGTDTTFNGETAPGGGFGGGFHAYTPGHCIGGDGGCGGGGGNGNGQGISTSGGTGTAGEDGGDGGPNNPPTTAGGGGGARTAGGDATSTYSGDGGDGQDYEIEQAGTPKYYAGGGGGAGYNLPRGLGGDGGGGQGGDATHNAAVGTDGLGGGGGGGSYQDVTSGKDGGDGIFVLRYTSATQLITGGNSVYQDGGDWVHVFTSSGNVVT
jgi:hypothetical protein